MTLRKKVASLNPAQARKWILY